MLTVYLDQLHWINLAKAHAGRPQWAHLSSFLDLAIQASTKGAARFPISGLHMMELARIGNRQQRETLAKLMVGLGAGWVLPSQSSLLSPWMEQSIRTLFSLPPITTPQDVVTRGFMNAFPKPATEILNSFPPSVRTVLESLTDTPEGWLSFLVQEDEEARRTAIERMTASAKGFAEYLARKRSQLRKEPRDIRYRAYCAILFNILQKKIARTMELLGLKAELLFQLEPQKGVELFQNIPVLDVEIELCVISEQQWSREPQPNDTYDVAALSVSIPFCDVVATEKYWAAIAKQAGLDARYNTFVCAQLDEVIDLLRHHIS